MTNSLTICSYRKQQENHYNSFSKVDWRITPAGCPSFRAPTEGDSWGHWVLKDDSLSWDEHDGHSYEIELGDLRCNCTKESCEHFLEAMHWVAHMAKKSAWLSAGDIGELVFALNDILEFSA